MTEEKTVCLQGNIPPNVNSLYGTIISIGVLWEGTVCHTHDASLYNKNIITKLKVLPYGQLKYGHVDKDIVSLTNAIVRAH